MATVNFSVPEDVKKAFNRAFKNTSKSAVIADLMRRAVSDLEMKKQRVELFGRLTELRTKRPPAANKRTQAIRKEVRK